MARPHSGYGGPEDFSPGGQQQQHIINMGPSGVDPSRQLPSHHSAAVAATSHRQLSPMHHNSQYAPRDVQSTSPRGAPYGMDTLSALSATSPVGSNNVATYASPRLAQAGGLGAGLAPSSGSGSGSSGANLGRSQSLGHAAYQQQRQAQTMQQQYGQQGSQHGIHQQMPASSPASQQSYGDAGGGYHRSREHAQPSYSEGSTSYGVPAHAQSGGPSGLTLLPTISNQIQSGSLSSPYSPHRNSMFETSPNASHTYAAQPPMSRSPASAALRSPYAPPSTAAHGNLSPSAPYHPQQQVAHHQSSLHQRPVSMLDSSTYGSSPRSAFTDTSGASPSQRYSPLHASTSSGRSGLRTATHDGSSSGLPLHHLSGSGSGTDSLPYAFSPGSQVHSTMSPAMQSPYQPLHASAGPPRNALPAGSAGSYVLPSAERDRRASMVASSFAPGATEGREWRQSVGSAAKPSHRRPPQEGFRKVRELGDLRPSLQVAQQGAGRRADPAGGHVSPLKAVTTYLHHTYHLVNPAFVYELSFNPRRVLTKPSKPMHNDGMDNEDSDYILYVNDFLGADEGNRYLILDVLGQGTFGQVVKCQNMKTHEIVAVKVIKNKPAYFSQSMMEVTILEMLNGSWDPNDEHHILRLRDTFIHAKHLCLVFELLSSNLYELIKQNGFKGLSTSLVRVFTAQLLDSLTVLNEARLIHCDLKPENILLKTLQTPSIKLVDFGSACHEKQTVYTYIQSRFYRSPEVLLGLPYSSMIDMWSLGCIAVELFLGLPLFPGTSEYNQITRIVEMLGLPPSYMLDQGKQTSEFFNIAQDEWGRKSYRLKSIDQYQKERNPNPPEQPSKRYFQATTLPDIVKTYPMARKSGKPADVQKEMANRTSFIDFVTGLLSMDPAQRWTPQQAKLHPFITGERFLKPFKPPATPLSPTSSLKSKASSPSNDSAKHPYGGLPQTTAQSSGRAYQDAAAYNQHLAQQQAYNSAHHARQTLPSASNNPYVQDATAQAQAQAQAQAKAAVKAQAHQQQLQASALAHAHQAASSPQGFVSPSGSGSTIQNRSRSNTMTRMDAVPPQLAKMGLEASPLSGSVALGSTRQSLTPVDSRDWDRRQQPHLQQNGLVGMSPGGTGAAGGGKLRGASQYQPLDAAQQQWRGNSPLQGSAGGYLPSHQGGSGFSVVVDGQDRRLVNPHDQHGAGGSSLSALASPSGGSSLPIAQPPPAAYASPSSAHAQASRFQSSSSAHQPPGQTYGAAGMSFDPYDTGIAQLMPALKPTQYQGSGGSTASTQRHSMALLPGQGGSGGSSHSHAGGAYGSGLVPGALLPSPNMSNPDDAFGILPSFDPNSKRRYSSAQGHQNF